MPTKRDAEQAATATTFSVLAAGALCWRETKGALEVLLIHRPRYDDWSWPKGKMDPGETMPETAVREVWEEVGLAVSLGIPLSDIEYEVNSGTKLVRYWAAKSDGMKPKPDGKEVDAVRWCSPEEALTLLSNPSDKEPLEELTTAATRGELATWPLIVVRHAKAKPRSSWTKAEGDRTLAATGQRQALAVRELLLAWRPGRVVTSPWARCVATVAPYAKVAHPKIKQVSALTEASHQRKPAKTAAAIEAIFDKHVPVAVCTHRPVLPTVLKVLAQHMPARLRNSLPDGDPYLAPGELIVCHVSAHNNSRIVSVETYKPFDD
ncbi:MAG: NUDIX hydrolase [Acidobacteria bacterium]|nr:NUDIX hydrolase [Acidobacteriota bacterium]